MDTSKLKTYAPAARREFIRAVTDRAHLLGLHEKGAEPVELKGDVAIIGGRPYPAKVAQQRKGLEDRIDTEGFKHLMEAVAYTWFNRFAALRYMELHGYLEHGYRVLSHPNGGVIPDILEHATDVDLPGLNKDKVIELKLAGNQDAELYRLLLVAQCNALANAMPFLFERIDDETELLLPDNLLHSDSLIRKLVTEIDEASWQQIEIIGWLYQFYISEKKDQVIGKVVASEDIPAATQLFTPNWIVKYMVQNALGAQWLTTYPDSKLREQMAYYIEPAEQTDEVKTRLAAITPSSLNPEELTLIDPACGSGHILVEAYGLFKAIYLERGYRLRDVPQLILEKNLYGLDIDERAAQLSGFALMMKARADDRRLFERGVKLNVMALVDSADFDAERLAQGMNLADYGLKRSDLLKLKELFEHATTFGSLIQVPEDLVKKLPVLKQLGEATSQDLFVSEALRRLRPLVQQAEVLAGQYDSAVANPPYMGSRAMIPLLKDYVASEYGSARPDVYAAFVLRSLSMNKRAGNSALITRHGWMTNLRFAGFRSQIIMNHTIESLVHLGSEAFPEISGEVVQASAFVIQKMCIDEFGATYLKLTDVRGSEKESEFLSGRHRYVGITSSSFHAIPGDPLVYSATEKMRDAFLTFPALSEVAIPRQGMATGDDDTYVRLWFEINHNSLGFGCESTVAAWDSGRKWFPFNKGGPFRKWFGNSEHVIAFNKESYHKLKQIGNHCPSEDLYFKEAVGWSDIATKDFAARYRPYGEIFATVSMSVFPSVLPAPYLAAFLNSKVNTFLINLTSPGLHYSVGYVANQPVPPEDKQATIRAIECIEISKNDWNANETGQGFSALPWVVNKRDRYIEESWSNWLSHKTDQIIELNRLEVENNRHFIDAYGLYDELSPEVPEDEITLTRADREKDCQRLISYALGCMMGRYSLDEPGLVYAHAGNACFEASRYKTFPADADGIVPITDEPWFEDDAANRVREFLRVVWGAETLDENLAWLAESLGKKGSETTMETVRRYLSDKFFKDHLQTYKKRPIYWLFSSGKHQAFQCLVYLHRYNEATLSRMRAEYVTPLQGKLSARVTNLQAEIEAASSTAARNKLQKRLDNAKKKQTELVAFDDLLRHYADQRISLDLDDGVKVNYGKFGNLLAEVKAVTGGAGDE